MQNIAGELMVDMQPLIYLQPLSTGRGNREDCHSARIDGKLPCLAILERGPTVINTDK